MEENKSITTQLNISNNDIVTMLLEEKKEQLIAEIATLRIKRNEIIEPYIATMANSFTEFYTSEAFLTFKQQCYDFAKIYNPDIEIKIDTSRHYESTEEEVRSRFRGYYKLTQVSLKPSPLYIFAIDEEEEDEIIECTPSEYFHYPIHLEKEFKFTLSEEDHKEYESLYQKIETYEYDLRHSDKLKDKMVAKMTKAAIMNNPELVAIRDSVLRLE